MIRFLFSLIAGGAVTFGLFYFMAFLISGGDKRAANDQEQIVVEIMTNPPESKVQERKRVPPPPPPPPKQPPKPQPPQPENSNPNPGSLGFNMPSVNVGSSAGGLSGPGAFGRDGDATGHAVGASLPELGAGLACEIGEGQMAVRIDHV